MAPPPPTPRIEGQQQEAAAAAPNAAAPASAAPSLSSYASLASAPPPSFARKTASPATTNATSSTSNLSGDGRTSSSLNREPPYGGGSGRYNSSAGRYSGRGSFRGGRERYLPPEDRYASASSGGTLSLSRELSTPRTGRGRGPLSSGNSDDGMDGDGGRLYNRRRGSGSSGRFDSSSRGRGRGRDYMFGVGGRAGRGGRSSYRGGRGSFLRDDVGRGSRGGSYADSRDQHHGSNSFSEDFPVDGPPPTGGEPGGFRGSGGSDGGRSVSPHPPPTAYAGRRTYGSFASENSGEFRRSTSQEGRPEEEDNFTGVKRRRGESFSSGEAEEPVKRISRDPDVANEQQQPIAERGPAPSSGNGIGPAPLDEGTAGRYTVSRADLADDGYRNNADDRRWSSSRDSPHSTTRMYSGNFDDPPYPDNYRDSSYGGRGRGRGRGGRGGYRGGRGGRGDFMRSSSGDFTANQSRDFGGRYDGGGDRRLSITASSEAPPRSIPQYSDLAAASTTSDWRRVESRPASSSLEDGPQPSPRDWRRLPAPPAPRVISSYATLATAPPPQPLTSGTTGTRPSSTTSSPTKTSQEQQQKEEEDEQRRRQQQQQQQQEQRQKQQPPPPEPEPERVRSPPPSPGPPSGLTIALARLADLEAQMEFAYAKHIMLARRHKVLMAQYDHLESLPVGVEAFQDELDKYVSEKANQEAEASVSHGTPS